MNYSEKKFNMKKYIIIIFIMIIIIFGVYFIFFYEKEDVDVLHSQAIMDICDAAILYEYEKGNVINENLGTIQIQTLIDEGYLDEEALIDPAYKKNIFGYSEYDQYISSDLYVLLEVDEESTLFCSGILSK
jgi:hypothetical protein